MISNPADNLPTQEQSNEDNPSPLSKEATGMSLREYYTTKYNLKQPTADEVEDSLAKYYISKYMTRN